jgi:Na+-transporting methylmalonyl-CoA/oxaloacetate decarboxylase gamma subunit
LTTALSITVIGMGLLFLALLLFYGLMSLMMSVLQRQRTGEEPAGLAADAEDGNGTTQARAAAAQARAAAVAVALARAELEQEEESTAWQAEEGAAVALAPSSWWTLHHQRQMGLRSGARRSR